MLRVNTSRLHGATLVGRARDHLVLSDRALAEGGNNLGCTSGELMLLAVGSCVVGNLNTYAAQHGANVGALSADVRIEETPDDSYGAITVDVQIEENVSDKTLHELREAAGSGRVTGRLRQNCEVRITVNRLPPTRPLVGAV